MKAFDVCVIPYLINEFTKNINPLKLYEYFASGKPVVATDIPECRAFVPCVRIAGTHEEFDRHVAKALEGDEEGLEEARVRVAEGSTWDRRVAEKRAIVEEYLAGIGRAGARPASRRGDERQRDPSVTDTGRPPE
jgi:glycosyltransferase involved in cell wall biosynthesis